ncbi:hypothetical protein K3152_11435 [Qipengyuania sp. 1NDH17]|uniref:Uncharacterized protein n=1 Tax=Qipengyuania polymorpha TaxID=2867234 RepID=A0ABS7J473_9SPHN|nr:hypothetical protein [Qipengyuania polymorpha]MBX7458859.1 hypothetical protein [Qipengyuania polymorpha]
MSKLPILAAAAGLALAAPLAAQPAPPAALTYADMVDLAEAAPLVIRARIVDQVALKPERAPDVAPGHVRLYIEAETLALIAGNAPLGQELEYLVDVPLNSKGKAPKLKKSEVLLFARSVPGRPGMLQLVGKGAQQPYSAAFEERLRPVLTALVAPDAPPAIVRVGDALAVEGTLVGESETQLFLDTANDGPVSITVVRRPNQPVRWGVSWSEIVDQSARPPAKKTLEWYRLACSLPSDLPAQANLSRDPRARAMAARDYAYVVEQLGSCDRSL